MMLTGSRAAGIRRAPRSPECVMCSLPKTQKASQEAERQRFNQHMRADLNPITWFSSVVVEMDVFTYKLHTGYGFTGLSGHIRGG
ncbi:hypothetical protein EYF80_045151 [Liparis tanakae]|uniref:Uncharacterized protein n=1 Tax=Liparis tanakae TaxID=230148 RepID=A0A4Z2FWC1_9TELE|nr:hypothetical protein EYF80_045151 [Liparis tanakae]